MGSSEDGKVDGEGPSVCFSHPDILVLDERGRLLVAELGDSGCLCMVEAWMTPRLAAEPASVIHFPLHEDYAKLLTETSLADVTFAVDSQRFPAYRGVLTALSPYFKALFESGQGMREGGGRAAGEDIVFEGLKAHKFEMLLEYLYAQRLTMGEGLQAGAGPGEMKVLPDRFQALGLYVHCVSKFGGGLKVGNVVALLVQVRDSELAELEAVVMEYLKTNTLAFQVPYCVRRSTWCRDLFYFSIAIDMHMSTYNTILCAHPHLYSLFVLSFYVSPSLLPSLPRTFSFHFLSPSAGTFFPVSVFLSFSTLLAPPFPFVSLFLYLSHGLSLSRCHLFSLSLILFFSISLMPLSFCQTQSCTHIISPTHYLE